MLPNGVLFENEEFEDDYLDVNLPVPLEYHYYSNGMPVNVTSETGYPEIVIDGTIVDQFSGLNSSGERTCSVDIYQSTVYSTGMLQHKCGEIDSVIISPPVKPPEPTNPWASVRWDAVPSPGSQALEDIVFDNGYFYTTGRAYTKIYRTRNGESGTWFTVMPLNKYYNLLAVSSVSGILLSVTGEYKVYRSSDDGVSWTEVVANLVPGEDVRIPECRIHEANGWALISLSWTTIAPGSYEFIYKRASFVTNDGITFVQINTEGNLPSGFAYKSGVYYIPMSNGTVWYSNDPTVWTNNGIPFIPGFYGVFKVIDGKFIISDRGRILTTNHPDDGWTVVNDSTPTLDIVAVIKVNSSNYFAICSRNFYKRSDDLITWTDAPMPHGNVKDAAYGNDMIMTVHDDGRVFAMRSSV